MNALKVLAVSGVMAAGVVLGGGAQALPAFTIAPSCLANAAGGQTGVCTVAGGGFIGGAGLENRAPFVADELNHAFKSTLDLNPNPGGGPVFTGTFTDNGNVEFSAFRFAGSNVLAGTTRLGVDYNMYATFTSTGTFSVDTSGNPVNVIGSFSTFTLDVWIDPDLNTTFNNNFSQTPDVGTATNDKKVATGTLISGDALLSFGLQSTGSFATLLAVTPLANANGFFNQPNPFYIYLSIAGNPQQINLVSGAIPDATFSLQGGGTAFFLVPEPASLTLFGAALIGLAAVARRRKLSV